MAALRFKPSRLRRRPLAVFYAVLAVLAGAGVIPLVAAPPVSAAYDDCRPNMNDVWTNVYPEGHADTYDRDTFSGMGGTLVGTGGIDIDAPGVLRNDLMRGGFSNHPITDFPAYAVVVRPPANAKEFTLRRDGSFHYVPRDGYFGADSFDYVAAISEAVCTAPTRVDLPASKKPYTRPDEFTSYGGATVTNVGRPCGFYCGLLDNDRNLASNGATRLERVEVLPWTRPISVFNDPAFEWPLTLGKLTDVNANGTFVYVPNPGATGIETFRYTVVNPGSSHEAFETVTIHLNAALPDTTPVAVDDTVTTDEDTPLTIDPATLLANDKNARWITLISASWLSQQPTYRTPHGSLAVTYADIIPGDPFAQRVTSITYTPDPDFHGVDDFPYYVASSYPLNTGHVPGYVRIKVNSVLDDLYAGNDAVTTLENQPVEIDLLANDGDPEGELVLDRILLGECNGCSHGVWTNHHDGRATFTPAPGFVGQTINHYLFYDVTGRSVIGQITVDVIADPAVDDRYEIDEDTTLDADVSLNDDSDRTAGLTLEWTSAPAHGQLTPDGEPGHFTYVPDPNYFGTDSFTYRYVDPVTGDVLDTATVTIVIKSVNDAPQVHVQPVCFAGDACPDGELRDVVEGNEVTVSGYLTDVEFNTGTFTIDWGDDVTTTAYPCSAPCAFGETPTFPVTPGCTTCANRMYFSFSHRYEQPPAGADDRYEISLTADDGDATTVTTTARVRNSPPTLTAAAAVSALAQAPVAVSGEFGDRSGNDTVVLAVNWGDGTPVEGPTPSCPADLVRCPLTLDHTYALPGTYAATITVTDRHGATATTTTTVTIAANPDLAPGAPTDVVGTIDGDDVVIAWTAPLANGGTEIVDYLIEWTSQAPSDGDPLADARTWTTLDDGLSAATTTRWSEVAPGTYWFRVTAVNGAGPGPASAPSGPVVMPTPVVVDPPTTTTPGTTVPVTTVPGTTVPGTTVPGTTLPGTSTPGRPGTPSAPGAPGEPTGSLGAASPNGTSPSDGALPRTGNSSLPLAAVGLLLLVGGISALVARRSRFAR